LVEAIIAFLDIYSLEIFDPMLFLLFSSTVGKQQIAIEDVTKWKA
jgi:hypothetical protein